MHGINFDNKRINFLYKWDGKANEKDSEEERYSREKTLMGKYREQLVIND